MKEVECFRYLCVDMTANGTMGTEMSDSMGEEAKVLGALRNLWLGQRWLC